MHLDPEQRRLRLRILEISHAAQASHLGSALSVVDIVAAIYRVKKPEDRFILSAGHSAAALYVVLEKMDIMKSPNLHELGVHPDRNPQLGIEVSTGSLGQGLPIALGMALADRKRKVWVVTSDGEMAEGSMWESLRIASEQKLDNLKLFINANGFGAYGSIKTSLLADRIQAFGWELVSVDGHCTEQLRNAANSPGQLSGVPVAVLAQTTSEQFPFLKGLDAHYYVMNEGDFQMAKECLLASSPVIPIGTTPGI